MGKTATCTGPESTLKWPLGRRPFRSVRTGKWLRRKANGWKKLLQSRTVKDEGI